MIKLCHRICLDLYKQLSKWHAPTNVDIANTYEKIRCIKTAQSKVFMQRHNQHFLCMELLSHDIKPPLLYIPCVVS